MAKKHHRTPVACDCRTIHHDVVEKVRSDMPSSETLLDVADFFRVLGDSTRLGILSALSRSEMCGCDLSVILNMSQSAVSHQLRLLKQTRLVRARREGKMIYFRLDDEHIREILNIGMIHTAE
ncbi:MAG: ArsR/SmtB family transcription factor [Chitinivibrionales bacterium]